MQTLTKAATILLLVGLTGALIGPPAIAQSESEGLNVETDTLTQTLLIHPPIDARAKALSLSIREHTYRPVLRVGDQLASDFTLQRVGEDGIPRRYQPGTDGTENEDWYGWRAPVQAPFDATVTRVQAPDTTNAPGTMNRNAQPGLLFFEDGDVTVVYGHVRELRVDEGETVRAGEVVARVGNNANSRAPHVHVGAWRNDTPLQIQVDLYAAERESTDENSEENDEN